MDFLELDPLFRQALQEDLGHGDITTDAILDHSKPDQASSRVRAQLISNQEFVLAGWPVLVRVFQLLGDVEADALFQEGDQIGPEPVGRLCADPAVLLKGERVALNFLQRMSGVATETRKYVDLVGHTKAKILDTRKTTPLWRQLEKYAVRVGGGQNHRFALDDGILVKENHIALAGGIRAAIQACRAARSHLQKVEIEVRNREELALALDAEADVVLLDNMSPEQVREAVQLVNGRCLLEVSGGVRESNILEYAQAGVDFISLGALTHSFRSVDLSLLLEI